MFGRGDTIPVLWMNPICGRPCSYTELNPVRASLVPRAECWGWSSAAAHCGADSTGAWLAMHLWRARWSAVDWRAYLDAGVNDSQLAAIRRSTYSGRPLGSQEF